MCIDHHVSREPHVNPSYWRRWLYRQPHGLWPMSANASLYLTIYRLASTGPSPRAYRLSSAIPVIGTWWLRLFTTTKSLGYYKNNTVNLAGADRNRHKLDVRQFHLFIHLRGLWQSGRTDPRPLAGPRLGRFGKLHAKIVHESIYNYCGYAPLSGACALIDMTFGIA
jgi:hypothetical protein